MSNQSRVALRSTKGRQLRDVVLEVLHSCRWLDIVQTDGRVAVKPNLSSPSPQSPHANTSREMIAAVCELLSTRTPHVAVCESDGMRHPAEAVFEAMGIYEMARRLGIDVVNLSKDRRVPVPNSLLASWDLPKTLLDADAFVTVPVLKTHARTVITGAVKNQWGCLPQHDRILLHKHLDRLLVDLNRLLRPRLAIMDATIAMEGRGPTNGDPVSMDLLLGSTDPVALDATAMRLAGFDPYTSKVLVLAAQEGLGNIDAQHIIIDGDLEAHRRVFRPSEMDWAIRALDLLTRSSFLTHHVLLNDSIFYPSRTAVNWIRTILRKMRAVRPADAVERGAQ